MAPSRTQRSTPRLSEVARHVVIPSGIVTTAFPSVEAKLADMGLAFDEWQRGIGQIALGKRADGKYAATVGGVVLSIPRQVGKTFLVGSLIFALCVLHPGMTVLWTAHRTRTASETFQKMKALSDRKKIKPLTLDPRSANGEQEIRFRNGSRILFGAREAGFGRGFDEVDVEVFDEAQILTEKALEDMVAATNQSRHPAGALLFYMGTPPRPKVDPGDAFREKRDDALSGDEHDTVYVEFSADKGANPDDQSQWAKANPSFPTRTPMESMKRLRKNVGSVESFLREGLGIWDETASADGDLPFGTWSELADPKAARGSSVVFGVDVAEDRAAWIAVAWKRPDGAVQVQLVDPEPMPAHRLVERCAELSREWGGSFTPPRAFEADLEDAGVSLVRLSNVDFPGACGDVFDAIESGAVRHGNQVALNEAVKAAKWRTTRNAAERAFQLAGAPEVGPLVAVTRALHGLNNSVPAGGWMVGL